MEDADDAAPALRCLGAHFQSQGLAVSDHHHLEPFVRLTGYGASEGFPGIHRMTVHPDHLVPGENPRLGRRIAGKHLLDHVDRESHHHVHGEEQDHRQQKVHQGAGRQNTEPLPGLLHRKAVGIVRSFVLSLKLDIAPHGQGPDGILGQSAVPGEKLGPHADAELMDPDPVEAGQDEMSELVADDQETEDDDKADKGLHTAHQKRPLSPVTARRRASASRARRSSRV